MGKPYQNELDALGETYRWAVTYNVSGLAAATGEASAYPLLCVGSGGSLTAAHVLSYLHNRATGRLAKPVTPLEAAATELNDMAVAFVSAQGANPDVLGAYRAVTARGPRLTMAVCARTASPLRRLCASMGGQYLFEFDPPTGKDGFLATNSLLATAVLLTRAYEPNSVQLPGTLPDLAHPGQTSAEFAGRVERESAPLWKMDTLVVLHGPDTQPAGVDVESKFTEGAIGHTQMADYRHFAHGRHDWIARHGKATGVLSLEARGDERLAERTIALFPPSVPVVRVRTGVNGAAACLSALTYVIHLVGAAGRAKDFDPGRPQVPTFGRLLYHLNAFGRRAPTGAGREDAAIARKVGRSVGSLRPPAELDRWREAYARFKARLVSSRFRGLVADYDGTLFDDSDREKPPSAEIADQLVRLAKAGIAVGIATGRGGSVRDALRSCLPREIWPRITVGYRNGSEVGLLNDDALPTEAEVVGDVLTEADAAIRADVSLMGRLRKLRARPGQVTAYPADGVAVADLWERVLQAVIASGVRRVQVLRSSHSVDIIGPGVSKLRVLDAVRGRIRGKAVVLCVGDRGRWPGNDYELLREPYSVTVDEASPDPDTCWPLSSAGLRGPAAMAELMAAFEIEGPQFRMVL